MKHFKQYRPLVIEEVSESTFHYPPHHQNYYELVYIAQGVGISHINTIKLPYHTGDLFFVSPEDDHYFAIQEYTTFIFVKFTNEYLKNLQTVHFPFQQYDFDPLSFFTDKYMKEQLLNMNDTEKNRIKESIHDILILKDSEEGMNSLVLYFRILLIFSSIHDHLKSLRTTKFLNENYNTLLINYIHQHIYEPEQLKIALIACHFNISTQYFSAWFKQTYQISYKSYIDHYRIELIKNRLAHSTASFQSIADEFGFTDSSHFSNYFFKHTNKRPFSFRKESLKLENILQPDKNIGRQ